MEPLRLKPRLPVAEPDIENWDDDDFQIETEDLTFRTASTATIAAPARRDSASSHMSFRSELESILDEETHVHVPGDDEKSTMDAIAAATQAGIPIPKNVPSSALMGGTIKRLGGRKIKKIIQDDWEDDLVLPESSQGLRIKPQDSTKFPDMLRQVSGGSNQTSPTKPMKTPPTFSQLDRRESLDRRQSTESRTSTLSAAITLDKFRDNDDDDDDFFGDGSETIKVSKTRPSKPISLITPPTPSKNEKPLDEDFENDFELPLDGKLRLSTRKDIPKTPAPFADDLDWGEGSLGTRFGGTRRDARSNRSSSVSAMSPSVSSSFTFESEDENFDGLVLPSGPVNFEERLQRRKLSRSPVRPVEEEPPNLKTPKAEAETEDLLDGLDVGDGDVFNPGKLTLHRNIRLNENRPPSPARPKTAVSLTFSNKPTPSRLPRPSHERTMSALEPVSESGGPIFSRSRRSQSRMGHQSQSSVTSVHSMPTPTTPSPANPLLPATPRRRELGSKASATSLRNEPTTTSSQLLRFKRSLPAMKASHSPAKGAGSRYERPPSRTESNRQQSGVRPKTPVERTRPAMVESHAAQQRRPFLPAGASQSQSQHVTAKTSRTFRRHDSENALDLRPTSRAFSRSTMRSPSPKRLNRHSDHFTPDGFSSLSFRNMTKPHRSRNFGDGHELDGFDDLPTSAQSEAKFIRQPAKAPLRNKIYQNVQADRTTTPSPAPYSSPAKSDYTPHFARDTQASRIARETSLAQRTPSGPLAPLTSSRVSQLSSRNNFTPGMPQASVRSKKKRNPPQLKPHLISNMNKEKTPQHLQGMFYNPETFRWEGNENVLNAFDPPASSPSTASVPQHMMRDKETSTPRPALITNISHTKGVQVVGGMVFDPQNMCWLKLGPQTNSKSEVPDPMDGFNALDDDEDVFKDIPDLEDNQGDSKESGRVSEVKDEWLVGEEFDVGPEFIRRQREEEDRWRKKCEKWLGVGDRDRDAWRWAIRDILLYQRAAQ
ncbi:cytokinesis regulator [Colletotrichum truncatum]|uniref:Cytokinesis regulator n=1 Tax=Colletotrichum truncatum TaxID=5467 RepID=A0ACC3ZA50_COLTU|nr:cytokinesis regulator [Colletotrichum truncatum]KAF6796141.1 cytokinesis regulator [Colletotrichum truncatum]